MATPLYSVYVCTSLPRGAVLEISSMAADITQADAASDFALQLLLEAAQLAGSKQHSDPTVVTALHHLVDIMQPCTLTFPAGDPRVEHAMSSGAHGGRELLSIDTVGDQVVLQLERSYAAFWNAAQHYVYYALPLVTPRADDEQHAIELAIAGRFPWLFEALRPGLQWESTAFSFAPYI